MINIMGLVMNIQVLLETLHQRCFYPFKIYLLGSNDQPTESPYDSDWYYKDFADRVRFGKVSEKDRLDYYEYIRELKILWDEAGVVTEYSIRYNKTQPGIWITSGPNNGSSLQEKFENFAGTIQVFKVVGDHMALTFCQKLPDPQLFTIILARNIPLSQSEINGVHNHLERKKLQIIQVTKVCTTNDGTKFKVLNSLFLMIISHFIFK